MKKKTEKYVGEQGLLMMCKKNELSSLKECLDKY